MNKRISVKTKEKNLADDLLGKVPHVDMEWVIEKSGGDRLLDAIFPVSGVDPHLLEDMDPRAVHEEIVHEEIYRKYFDMEMAGIYHVYTEGAAL